MIASRASKLTAQFTVALMIAGAGSPVLAQVVIGSTPGERRENAPVAAPPVTPALPDTTAPPITVRGIAERKSAWRRAEGDHAIVYSNGSESDLVRLTANLDREYAVLSEVFGPSQQSGDTTKPTIVLVGGNNFAESMHLLNARGEEGPFTRPFRFQRLYDPRFSGTVIAVGRSDQFIPVAAEALADDPFEGLDDAGEDAAYDDDDFDADPIASASGKGLRRPLKLPHVNRAWEDLVYSAFAQHFVLSRFPASYPRWYLDGVGALFSTLAFAPDRSVQYGRTPDNFAAVYNSNPVVPARTILAGETALAAKRPAWSPYQAWVIAHYFLLGDIPAERREAFARYMHAISSGTAPSTAAMLLVDPTALDAAVRKYAEGSTFYYTLPAASSTAPPNVSSLSPREAEALRVRVELVSRVEAAANGDAKEQARLAKFLARLPADLGIEDALLAEAQCTARQIEACERTVSEVLSARPNDTEALGWHAMALTEKAVLTPSDDRPGAIDAALRAVIAANRADNEALAPLVAYFRLYTGTGRRAPEKALLGMMKVVETVPEAPGPRLALGRELALQGLARDARRILLPIAFGGYQTPEQAEAARIVSGLPATLD